MEKRHEQEWARMANKGDATFQEVFSMTSLANSVKLLPWCNSSGIPFGYMDDALVATTWQGKAAPATTAMPKPEKPSAPGLSSNPAHSTEILSTRSFFWGHPFFKSLASPLQKKRDHSTSRLFGDHHGKRTKVDSPEVEAGSEHSSTWGGNHMPKLIPDTKPSSAQWR